MKDKDVIDTEHLQTVMLVFPKKEDKKFLAQYETMEGAYRQKLEAQQQTLDDDNKEEEEQQMDNEKLTPEEQAKQVRWR